MTSTYQKVNQTGILLTLAFRTPKNLLWSASSPLQMMRNYWFLEDLSMKSAQQVQDIIFYYLYPFQISKFSSKQPHLWRWCMASGPGPSCSTGRPCHSGHFLISYASDRRSFKSSRYEPKQPWHHLCVWHRFWKGEFIFRHVRHFRHVLEK